MHSTLRRFVSSNQINATIKSLVQKGLYQQALDSYSKPPNSPIHTSRFIFPSLLKACASLSYSRYGESLHCAIAKLGLHLDPFIATSLVRLYVKCGSLSNAAKLFDKMSQCETLVEDVALWNSIVDGYFKSRLFDAGMAQFRRMQVLNVDPDVYTVCIFLGICNDFLGFSYGKEIHSYVLRNKFDDEPFVVTAMIEMYSKSNRVTDAWNVFTMFGSNNYIAVWNSMINGFCKNGFWTNCLNLYSLAKNENLEVGSTTFSSVLTACSNGEVVNFGFQLHCDVVKTGFVNDPYVSTSLLTFYSKCGLIENAERVFYSVRNSSEVGIWNSMISAYVNCGCANDALDIYIRMRGKKIPPDVFTVLNALVACGSIGLWCSGMMIHGELIKRPVKDCVAVQSALLTMYSKIGSLKDAYKVFGEMKKKDLVAWGSMISACRDDKKFEDVLYLFKMMISDGVKLDSIVVASAIIACIGYSDEKLGFCIHGSVIKNGLHLDSFTGSVLIEFYSKFGKPDMANRAFSNVLKKNIVLWNSLMSCYSENGLPGISVGLLPQIRENGLVLDSISITTVLSAVSQMAVLIKGKTIHCYRIKFLISNEIQVENTLIDMYVKCGCFDYARRVFDKMLERDVVAWNTMIAGYGSHGECRKAIGLFNEMRASRTSPDEITFLSLISSCNHNGFVDEGLDLFRSMREHGIDPRIEHYVNIVDLLGRAGCVNEAFRFIEEMDIEPDRGVWLSLLSACRVHRNVELGEVAADNLIKLEPGRGGNYVQLLNLYVEAGLKEKAGNLRAVMRQKGLTKMPGCSWIEVRDKIDVFYSGDSFSDRTVEIYEILDGLKNSMKRTECDLEVDSN
ncbi:pentatricopeptide repeat-containing protein at2g40720 [Phtheirospermum japonicum]|uniref:Pentatricopeptide repeat-containing protein at2g40720 n=1 Tax=Phtheirospermum japonicum TaxID=374723 RepID=A0A830BSD4_9LAMI|nr:pentatricopeptide repeat-containing protein at2g40720 [Phtheirospermum japonicum]